MAKEAILAVIISYSKLFGVDPDVAIAVASVESNFQVESVGPIGELGLFQIRPEFYPMFNKKELKEPRTNIMMGVKKLSIYQKTCVHKKDLTWLICYNYGPANAEKVKYPELFPYVVKVKKEIENIRLQKQFNKHKNNS